ncbi:MAG: hypothetical protein INH41_00865 [Myxococcaceae bacterium]|nr:hypothetical protein [Myxococcaceae bacterium]MCA3010929.1 hypothetical protein [Myxococcaceae bacterium]
MLLTTTALLTLLSAREPLPIPGWVPPPRPPETSPAPVEVPPAPLVSADVAPPAVAEAGPVVEEKRRNVAITFGLGALVLSPSIELEVAPWRHVSLYAGGELSVPRLGGAVQAGVRLRPLDWLVGPFLDLHVRFGAFAGLLTPAVEEVASPGVMGGFTWVSDGGFVVTAGMGVSLLAKTTTTTVTVGSSPTVYVPGLDLKVTQETVTKPSFEMRLAIGHAF